MAMDLDAVSTLVLERVARAADRGLGDLEVRSNIEGMTFAAIPYRAARNLLLKAGRALAIGDLDRMNRYIDRALELPFDEVEQVNPAVQEAHMGLYSAVTDAVESADEDCSCWLDAAESALAVCGDRSREDLLGILRLVDSEYQLQEKERRRVRKLTGDVVDRDVTMTRVDDDRGEQVEVIVELLRTVAVYDDGLSHAHRGH
jgi:hypothetical protein